MPVKTDLAQAYRSYYTHENEGSAEAPVHHRRKNPLVRFLKNLFSLVFVFFPIRNMYLEHVKPGRLLEIGCGNGKRLKRMQRLGWEVTGQEIDPISAAVARASGKCDVFVGELENLAFPENYFDAIITNHVLEHAYDPLVLMRECYRILKPQGRLVIVTPNSESLGHRYFKKDWLGVDPPRHLHIFKTNNLSDLGIKGGFKVVKSWTTIANVPLISWLSFQIKANIHNPVRRFSIAYAPPAILFIFLAALYRLVDRNSGEECVMLTIK
ncbi:MAG: class I SAM-dependent methyltransferase [Candidatus Omnitrophota bacterium]